MLEAIDAARRIDTAPATTISRRSLGDLLFQIVFHPTLASEQGAFTAGRRRRGHPRQAGSSPSARVRRRSRSTAPRMWSPTGSRSRRPRRAATACSTASRRSLPALLYALKVQKKAAGLGLDPALVAPPLADAVDTLGAAPDTDAIGRLLLASVGVARAHNVDPEAALRAAAIRLRDAGQAVEGR